MAITYPLGKGDTLVCAVPNLWETY